MNYPDIAEGTSGGRRETFTLDWYSRRWSSSIDHDMADFPYIAQISGKRFELYGDGTFDEEEVSRAVGESPTKRPER